MRCWQIGEQPQSLLVPHLPLLQIHSSAIACLLGDPKSGFILDLEQRSTSFVEGTSNSVRSRSPTLLSLSALTTAKKNGAFAGVQGAP